LCVNPDTILHDAAKLIYAARLFNAMLERFIEITTNEKGRSF
jgi:hypothetical protein